MSDMNVVQLAVHEIEQYAASFAELLVSLPEDQLWSTGQGLPNSIGVLARHLTGNLNHYFGVGLLNSDYHRERDREFSESGVSKAQVIADLKEAVKVARQAADSVDISKIDQPFVSPDGNTYESLSAYAFHMAAHFALHYGQADYARYTLK